MLTIKRASNDDLNDVMQLLRHRQEWLKQCGINQWQSEVKPFEEQMKENIDAGYTWIATDSNLGPIGTLSMSTIPDRDFWTEEEAEEPSYYLYKMVTSPNVKGKGYGSAMLSWANQYSRSLGLGLLRWDANANNLKLRKYYTDQHANYLGTITVSGRESGDKYEMRGLITSSHSNVQTSDPCTVSKVIDSRRQKIYDKEEGTGEITGSPHYYREITSIDGPFWGRRNYLSGATYPTIPENRYECLKIFDNGHGWKVRNLIKTFPVEQFDSSLETSLHPGHAYKIYFDVQTEEVRLTGYQTDSSQCGET